MKKTSITTHFQELETLIDTLETKELPLEDALETYSKAIKVTKSSVTALTKSSLKLEDLSAELTEFLDDNAL
tara:strand:- start:113 stop:328 length:216 start_codon:yes stop_codon:yes gene_type:complete